MVRLIGIFFLFLAPTYGVSNTNEIDPNCSTNFASLDPGARSYVRNSFLNATFPNFKINQLNQLGKRTYWWRLGKKKATEELQNLKDVKIKEVMHFETIEIKASAKAKRSKKITTLSRSSKASVNQLFDALLEGRVRMGEIPRSLAVDWREWLKAKNGGQPYPMVDDPDFIRDLIESSNDVDATMADLFNYQYLVFLNEAKGLNVRNVDEAMKAYPAGFVRELSRAALRPLKKTKQIFYGAAMAVLIGSTAFDVVHSAVAPVLDPIKELLNGFTKSASETIVDTAKVQYTTKFQEGKEKYSETIKELTDRNLKFLQTSMDGLSRLEAKSVIDNHQTYVSSILPKFSPVIDAADKEFNKKWEALLEGMRDRLATTRLLHSTNKIALENIESRIKQRGTKPTNEEIDAMASYTRIIRDAEKQLAIGIGAWAFYKSTLSSESKLDSSLHDSYKILYEEYVSYMDLDVLKRELAGNLRRHIDVLAQYQ
ncbi:MAG: hypothetical protein M9962_11430 [Oligoflexia bacterium]|nr:hypothetical protein [Oligoflexia bacterium]